MMDNDETEMIYQRMQVGIKDEITTLTRAKELVMQCAGLRHNDELGRAAAAINAEIGALEYLLESNRVAHDRNSHYN